MNGTANEPPVRFTKSNPCPICGGYDGGPRGQGVRCYGFLSGLYAHCTREEYAGGLPCDSAGTYAHFLGDSCRCRKTHNKGTDVPRFGIVGGTYCPPPCDPSPIRRTFPTAQACLEALASYETRRKGVPVRVTRIDLYPDASGAPWMAEGRSEWGAGTKSYKPCHYTAQGWQTGDPKGSLPLYNLPLVIGSDRVLVVEGPKCAEIASKLGFVATTSSHGANAAHRADWSPLAGKDVVILPDCDDPGRKYEAAVRGLLAQLDNPPLVKVLNLPGLSDGEDIEQWMDRCPEQWTTEDIHAELERLIAEIPVEVERWATAEDALAISKTLPRIWPGWIAGRSVNAFSGFAGVGKTRFAGDLLKRIVLGMPWPDGQPMTLPPDSRFLWLCADGQHLEAAEMCKDFGIPLDRMVFPAPPESPFDGTDIDDPETQATIRRAIQATRPVFVIVDSITSATSMNICTPQTVPILKRLFLSWCEDFGCTVVFLSHLSAEGQLLGRQLLSIARSQIDLNCPDPSKSGRLSLGVLKHFGVKPPPLGVTMGNNGNTYDNNPPERVIGGKPAFHRKNVPSDLVSKASAMILESLAEADHLVGNTLIRTWVDATPGLDFNQTRSAFWTAVDQLVDTGKITKDGGIGTGHQVTLHRIVVPTNGQSTKEDLPDFSCSFTDSKPY